MRDCALNVRSVPSGEVALTVTEACGPILSSIPSMSYVSNPVSPSDWRVSPFTNSSGRTPIPTRLDRWIRSNDSAMTARTPSRSVPFAAQSRDDPIP